ncbi:[Fe-Fe] hydrogenase large subunit C-terminal domain-containing protein [Thermosediminibacter litoriperuensis]|uniref:[Fe-Fe] hydrogenase large subunit C-terminal domain-containing protein n=1 Tax=Thermosediminibacter litoriperuensis TaxID=291989 RepID=UPI0011E6B7F6|nr:[Fe-Fe] hydrogenase large subunit C-terminal domain-containing protein [Thermosediminibacter litoriperuensis]
MNFYHSVTLDLVKCKGCTNCIKGCPTEAIRVRGGKAHIMQDKCIDCGECIRICPNHAKYAVTDGLEKLKSYKFTVALPAPSLYAQFKEGTSREAVNAALHAIGFDEVYEVPLAAEEVTVAIREYLKRNHDVRPLISSSCPAVLRLIRVRFPGLIKNIVPVKAPVEIAGKRAKEEISSVYGIKPEETGAFFISPCPAKVTSVKQPIGTPRSHVDGVLSISGIYGELMRNLGRSGFESIFEKSSGIGIGWGRSGGENIAIGIGSHLAVDGIHNCIDVLEEIELNKLSNIDYLELQACSGGCIGGALTVENRFVAKVKLIKLAEKLGTETRIDENSIVRDFEEGYYNFEKEINPTPSLKLDEDIAKAIRKMEILEKTLKELPGLDCGSCGCPNCRSLAEDIVQGRANETDCVFKLREKVRQLVAEVLDLSQKLPPTMEGQEGVRKSDPE